MSPTGKCYEFANATVIRLGHTYNPIVVQATVRNPGTNKEIAHSWVEVDGQVIDEAHEKAGQPISIKKFYHLYLPENIRRFNFDQVCRNVLHYGHTVWPKEKKKKKNQPSKRQNPSDDLPLTEVSPPFAVYAFIPRDPDDELSSVYTWESLWFSSLRRNEMASYSELNLDAEPGEKIRSIWFDDPTIAFNFADKIADLDRIIVVVKLSLGLHAVTMFCLPWATQWSKELKTKATDGINFHDLNEVLEENYWDSRIDVFNSFPGSHWRKYDWEAVDWYQ